MRFPRSTAVIRLCALALTMGVLAAVIVVVYLPERTSLTANDQPMVAQPRAMTKSAGRALEANAPAWERTMLARVNALRRSAGVKPVKLCGPLMASAQAYADTLAANDMFSHVGPDGSEPLDRIRASGVKPRQIAENIAAGTVEEVATIQTWTDSPEHYANMVEPAMRMVGFGRGENPASEYGVYWVLDMSGARNCYR